MAPKLVPADLLRPPVAQRPSLTQSSASNPRSGFQDYLDALQSPVRPSTPPTGDPAGPTRPEAADGSTSPEAERDEPGTRSGPAKAGDDDSGQARSTKKSEKSNGTADASTPGQVVTAQPDAPTAKGDKPVVVKAGDPDSSGPAAPVPIANFDATPVKGQTDGLAEAQNVSAQAGSTSQPVIEASQGGPASGKSIPLSVDVDAIKQRGKQSGSGLSKPVDDGLPVDAGDAESASSDDARTIRDARAPTDKPIGADSEDSARDKVITRVAPQLTPQRTGRDPVIASRLQGEASPAKTAASRDRVPSNEAQPSFQEQKVKIAASRETNGGANGGHASSEKPAAEMNIHCGQAGSPAGSASNKVADLLDGKSVTVRSADGDGAAASIGKALVQSSEDSVKPISAGSEQSKDPGTIASVGLRGATVQGTHAAKPASTVAALLTTTGGETDPVESAVRILSSNLNGDRHQATLKLDPPELGQLRIDIRMHEAGMTLRVDAESAAAAKLIESRLPELKDALSLHGIRFERSEVVVRSPETTNENPSGKDSSHSRSEFDQTGNQPSNWFADSGRSDASRDERGWQAEGMNDNFRDESRVDDSLRGVSASEYAGLPGSVNLVA